LQSASTIVKASIVCGNSLLMPRVTLVVQCLIIGFSFSFYSCVCTVSNSI